MWQDSHDRKVRIGHVIQCNGDRQRRQVGMDILASQVGLQIRLYRSKRTGWPGHFCKGQDSVTMFRKCTFL
jgi:hypothetical protein